MWQDKKMIGPSRRVEARVRSAWASRYSFGPDLHMSFFSLEPHNQYSGGSRASRRYKVVRRVRVSQREMKVVHTILYLKLHLYQD